GTNSEHDSPSVRHSNVVLPPSWRSTLDVMMRVPKPDLSGATVGGPPASRQSMLIAAGSTCQLTASAPELRDSAPYFAALVASSCKASASVCAVVGSRMIFGPERWILSA